MENEPFLFALYILWSFITYPFTRLGTVSSVLPVGVVSVPVVFLLGFLYGRRVLK